MNRQIEEYREEKREEIVRWLLSGEGVYRDDIEYVGDWVCVSVYLPRPRTEPPPARPSPL